MPKPDVTGESTLNVEASSLSPVVAPVVQSGFVNIQHRVPTILSTLLHHRVLDGSSLRQKMFTLEEVVPWGRSFDEYHRMFGLSDDDLVRKILGCGDGPASFNAEATRRGAAVISCDPIYRWEAVHIFQRGGNQMMHIRTHG